LVIGWIGWSLPQAGVLLLDKLQLKAACCVTPGTWESKPFFPEKLLGAQDSIHHRHSSFKLLTFTFSSTICIMEVVEVLVYQDF
jgi:hypothetical protein